jgi:hypothetical protein
MPPKGSFKPFCKHGHDRRQVGIAKDGGCTACHRILSRQDGLDNRVNRRSRHNLQMKRWRKENPQSIAKTVLKMLYGLTVEKKDELLRQQDNKCALCLSSFDGNNVPCVDHIHDETKQVRGLLCHACNSALGLFKDNALVLQKAVDYIIKWRV